MNMQIKLPSEHEIQGCKEQGFSYIDGVFTRINPLHLQKQELEINEQEEVKLLKECNYWIIFWILVIATLFVVI